MVNEKFFFSKKESVEKNIDKEEKEENKDVDHGEMNLPGEAIKVSSQRGHLKGWQWRESKRALEKKERAKSRNFKKDDKSDNYERMRNSFIIPLEKSESLNYGVVSGMSRGRIKVFFGERFYDCMIDQGLPFELNSELAAGDHVTIKVKGDRYFIDHVIERKTVLSRLRHDSTRWGYDGESSEHVIAANVDVAVIVVSAKNPPLHPKLIDRYLVLVKHGKIKPVLCINKVDLGMDDITMLDIYKKEGIDVVETSISTGQGIEDLKKILEDKKAVLVGNSGVGKSSLINSIVSESFLPTGEVSDKTGRGKHTTTSSDLIVWKNGSYIIDTPGVRSLGMTNVGKEDLQLYFSDIYKFTDSCKYPDCVHDTENDCGVKDAVDSGVIDKQRYESYIKILREIS